MCPTRSLDSVSEEPFDASLQLDTYISFSEIIFCAHKSYSLMLLFNGNVGYTDYIKKLFSMHFTQTVHFGDL